MYKTRIILITLLIALVTAANQQNNQDCSPSDLEATGLLKSFPIAKTETIPQKLQCTWKITTKQQQNILVYLMVNGTATEKQCIKVADKVQSEPKPICGKPEGNTFKSNGQEVTVTYTYEGDSTSMPNFLVMYRFANSDYCTANSLVAMNSERSFKIIEQDGAIQQNTYCLWTITTSDTQKIMVHLGVDATDKQCVSVSNSPQDAGKKICGKQVGNTFTSEGQEVTVTYPAPDTAEGVENFQVFYKSENSQECSTNISDASAVQQSFPITTTETIAKGTLCKWTIKAASPQKVLVYLAVDGTATETQCITVDNKEPTGPKTICGKPNENSFTSTGQEVTVSYSSAGASAAAPNFRVMYQFANNDVCTVTSPMATDTEQSFDIIKTGETIPNDVYCTWTIIAPSPKKVMVRLAVEGTTTENQCVSVSNNPSETGKKVCGKANEDTFTSDGQKLTVTYPASPPAANVKNFKLFYQASDARRDTAWIAGILSVYILSQLLL